MPTEIDSKLTLPAIPLPLVPQIIATQPHVNDPRLDDPARRHSDARLTRQAISHLRVAPARQEAPLARHLLARAHVRQAVARGRRHTPILNAHVRGELEAALGQRKLFVGDVARLLAVTRVEPQYWPIAHAVSLGVEAVVGF